MEVSKQLKKQIIIEVIALIFFIGVICYALFAINKGNANKVASFEGFVIVLDDAKYRELKVQSDGLGLQGEGVTYTVTNNNKDKKAYKVVITPSVKDEDILKQIRVSVDDLYLEDLVDLEKIDDGYVLTSYELDSGYTKVHLIKYWYKLDSDEDVIDKNIKFTYKLVREE